MKVKVNNKLYFISLIILIFWFVFELNTFLSSYNKNKEYMENDYEMCISSNSDEDVKVIKKHWIIIDYHLLLYYIII